MAPFSLMTAGVSWLAKSFTVFSCTSTVARCASVLPATCVNSVKCLTTQTGGPPKRPLNGYIRYVMQEKPVLIRQYPDIKRVEVIRKLAQQWNTLSPEQKRPFEEGFVQAMEQFKVDLQKYQAQLTPAEVKQQALEKRQRMARRKNIRKKKELTSHGRPKNPRTAFNIFISEHFVEARGTTMPAKFKSLTEDWRSLLSHQKEVYIQLAEDDKIRYKSEMKSWEDHMIKIGRVDLTREGQLSAKKAASEKAAKKVSKKAAKKAASEKAAKKVSKKAAKKAPAKTGKEAPTTGMAKTTRKTTNSSSKNTV